ncbi:hypothetical protein F5Y16DRAFT_381676 [Xylariaceae sp. FL0255]|nr:hypothetical protein F5Y16DRAFT_381676 [Xylariaceae sp. FL0255]
MSDSPAETSDGALLASASNSQPAHLRSCILCRQRKIKCDRRQPCSNCVKSRATCVHPPGAGRAAKRPRQAVDTKVLDRLSQLEGTIKRLQTQAREREAASGPSPPSITQAQSPKSSDGDTVPTQELGRLVVEETQSHYVSNVMWADLTESIEQLRGLFVDDEEEDEVSFGHEDGSSPSADSQSASSGALGTNASIFGYRSVAHSLKEYHPPLQQSVALYQLFIDNISPIVRIFHLPTVNTIYWKAVSSLDSIDKDTETLLFSIYFSAVISLDAAHCDNLLGMPRTAAIEKYRFATEQSLARANFLNTKSVLLLQGAVLYLSVLRSDDGTRTVWSLTSLAVHVARGMGLHRDGALFDIPPFEAEIRRRLWHHLYVLDYRATEYHGCEPILTDKNFDVKMPLNINDVDICQGMTELPPEREGATDMSFFYIRCLAINVAWNMSGKGRAVDNPYSLQERLSNLREFETWAKNYVQKFDLNNPLLFLTERVSKFIVLRNKILGFYTELVKRKRGGESYPTPSSAHGQGADCSSEEFHVENLDTQTLKDHLFESSTDLLEMSLAVLTNHNLDRWAWHTRTYLQWYAIVLVLSEICVRPPSPQCERAWKCASATHDEWLRIKNRDNSERGSEISKPISRLMARAQRVRAAQQAQLKTPGQAARSDAGEWLIPGQRISYDTPKEAPQYLWQNQEPFTKIDQGSVPSVAPSSISMPQFGNPAPGDFQIDAFLEMLPSEITHELVGAVMEGNQDASSSPDSHVMMSGSSFFRYP